LYGFCFDDWKDGAKFGPEEMRHQTQNPEGSTPFQDWTKSLVCVAVLLGRHAGFAFKQPAEIMWVIET